MAIHKRSKEYRAINNKSIVVPFRMTPAERADLETLATVDGYTSSDYIRKALKLRATRKRKKPHLAVVMSEVEMLRRDHAGIARNINQLTTIGNKNGWLSTDQVNNIEKLAKEAADLVAKMDRHLFGDEDDDGDHRN